MCPIRRNSLLVHVAYPKYLGQMAQLLLLQIQTLYPYIGISQFLDLDFVFLYWTPLLRYVTFTPSEISMLYVLEFLFMLSCQCYVFRFFVIYIYCVHLVAIHFYMNCSSPSSTLPLMFMSDFFCDSCISLECFYLPEYLPCDS